MSLNLSSALVACVVKNPWGRKAALAGNDEGVVRVGADNRDEDQGDGHVHEDVGE